MASDLLDKLKKDIHYIEGMNSCMNCGVCTAICPAAEFYNYDPRVIVDSVQRNDEATIKELISSDMIWYCGECMSCKTRCPRGNTPGSIIMALRKLAQEEGTFIHSEKGRQQYAIRKVIVGNVLEQGYCITPDIVKPEMHPEQGPVWEWIYENRADVYERLHANLGKEGAGAVRQIDKESMDELHQIFEVTGGHKFLDSIEQFSKEYADQKGMDMDEYFLSVYMENNGEHTL
ncbi:4Fe-4S dicluster domain-containing protein [Porphyromonadaceae bacterium OttesenSCG-928-L07]|nr:4Fe-4S dicluster domain-containing protein [Porphyromonadaceae bacterium OttesenSCG-928-L07]MDL2251246.1 4Fe-4S dicluster domain-containing protein [Odoribacter sp. OttesenSCG-928-J03]